MKKIVFLISTIVMMQTALAQSTETDTAANGRLSVNVGLSAGATLYANGYYDSPYYSKYGLTLQVPVLVNYDFAPHWRLSSGLRYDFNWDPLYNDVVADFSFAGGYRGISTDVPAGMNNIHARIFHGYLGVPLKLTWYPKANDHQLLSLSFDCYAAYAVNKFVKIQSQGAEDIFDGLFMKPWKLEVGLTVASDVLGIIHGVRLFGNLLPQYQDQLTGEKIYNVGMTFFF